MSQNIFEFSVAQHWKQCILYLQHKFQAAQLSWVVELKTEYVPKKPTFILTSWPVECCWWTSWM